MFQGAYACRGAAGEVDLELLQKVDKKSPLEGEACTEAALLLHAVSAHRPDSEHARFWRRYRHLLPRRDEVTSSTMFEPEQYGWLQVRVHSLNPCACTMSAHVRILHVMCCNVE